MNRRAFLSLLAAGATAPALRGFLPDPPDIVAEAVEQIDAAAVNNGIPIQEFVDWVTATGPQYLSGAW